jgi:hypothetical protein
MIVRTLALALINAHLTVFALYLIIATSQKPDRVSGAEAIAAACLSVIVFWISLQVEKSTPKGSQRFAVAFLLCTALVYIIAEATFI